MVIPFVTLLIGLVLLILSADRFVEAAAAAARHLGMAPMLIGLVVVGFGTSAPEMVVSAISAYEGYPQIALGNAYGSNIANIALILGLSALLFPIQVRSRVILQELPVLIAVTALAGWQLWDGNINRSDAILLLICFAGLMGWSIWRGIRENGDTLTGDTAKMVEETRLTLRQSLIQLAVGLLVLVISSRLLVWGAVEVATELGVSELVIGLSVVAIGTSLPELASTLAAVRRNEHDLALGNIIGSNLFNTLAVVGIAGIIEPIAVDREIFTRDFLMVAILTLTLFVLGISRRGKGRISRLEGAFLLASFIFYMGWLLLTT